MLKELLELKAYHQIRILEYGSQMREHIEDGYRQDCDYYQGRREMEGYHRGAWNALNELELKM